MSAVLTEAQYSMAIEGPVCAHAVPTRAAGMAKVAHSRAARRAAMASNLCAVLVVSRTDERWWPPWGSVSG